MAFQPGLFPDTQPSLSRGAIWGRRLKLAIFVVFCVELGMVLIIVPWTPLWTENSLLADYPMLQLWLSSGIVRGVVSGLGLLDLWIGILHAVRYRERPPN
jgi:hypothetical protein